MKEALLAIGISVSETNKISRYNSFFHSFHKLYKKNPKHNGTLLHAIQTCLISRASVKTNTKFQIVMLDFFLMLRTFGKRAYSFVTANLPLFFIETYATNYCKSIKLLYS